MFMSFSYQVHIRNKNKCCKLNVKKRTISWNCFHTFYYFALFYFILFLLQYIVSCTECGFVYLYLNLY